MKKEKLHIIKSPGFKTPKDYFESFDDKLMQHLNNKEIIEGIEVTGFKVPDAYFNTVENVILNRIKEDDKTPVIKLKSRTPFYYVASIAASLLLLFAIFFNTKNNTDELSAEIVEAYFQDSDLDSYQLAQLLSDADLLEDDFTIAQITYNEDNLETYLLENADLESFLE